MEARTLHVLTPQSQHSPPSLLEGGGASSGDLIADFRRFPSLVYQAQADGTCRDVTADLLAPSDYWTIARQWLQGLTEAARLQEAMSIEGFGVWWTLNGQRFTPALSDIGNTFAWIDLLDAVRQNCTLGKVLLHGHNVALGRIVPQVFSAKAVRQSAGVPGSSRQRSGRLSRIALRAVRVVMGTFSLLYSSLRRPQVCFLTSTTLLRAEKGAGGEHALRDVYLGEVERALRARGWRTLMVEHHGDNLSWPALRSRGLFFPYDILLLFSLLRFKLPLIGQRVLSRWRSRWSALQPTLGPHMRYRGYDLSSLILPLLRRGFLWDAPLLEGLVGLWRWILRRWRPRLFYINCSYGQSAIPIIIAARSLGIPTVEQQHGIIAANHKAYLVPASLQEQARVPWCDHMVVWGEFTKRLLVGAGTYPPHQVAVCGFPRLDALLRCLPPRQDTRASLGIPQQAQVVLYTSNMIVEDLYAELLDSLRRVPDPSTYWVVKLHPREKTRALWEQAVQERRIDRVRIVEDEVDFYALLAACDLHISFISTTMIEAAVLGKPNLGLSFASVPDPVGYAEAGGYLPVEPWRLGEMAHSVLHDHARRQALLQEQKRFAEDWCRHDGSSVACIVDLIERTIGAR